VAETIGITLVFNAISRSAEQSLRQMKSGLGDVTRAHITLERADSRSEKQARRSAVAFEVEAHAIEQVGDESLKTAAKQKVMQAATDETTRKVDTLADAVGGSGGRGRKSLRRAVFDANQGFNFFGNAIKLIKWPAIISFIGLAAQAISALGAGIIALTSSLGSAISALSGFVSVLASASGALVAYPAILTAAAQGVGTFMLAFGGLKDAMKEQQTGVSAVAQAQLGAQSAQQGYQAALKAQADALQQNGAASLEYQQATLAVAQAQQSATQAEKALAEARQSSNAQIQAFAKFLDTEAKPKLKELQAIAAQGILPDLTEAGRKLLSGPLFSTIRTGISRQSRAIGEEINKAAGSFNTRSFAGDIGQIFANNTEMTRGFARGAVGLAHALTDILVAARPLTRWFGQLAERLGAWTQHSVRAARESGKLTQFFEHSRQTLSKLGQIIGNVGEALFRTFSRGKKLGDSMLDGLVKITQKWADWTNSIQGRFKIDQFFERSAKNARIWGKMLVDLTVAFKNVFGQGTKSGETLAKGLANAAAQFRRFTETARGRNSIRKWFEDAIPPLQAMGNLALAVTKAFGRLGSEPGLAQFIDKLRKDLLPAVEQLFRGINKAFGPALVDALTAIAKLIADLAGASGPLTVFVKTIGAMASAFDKIINTAPPLKAAIVSIVGALAVLKALKLGGSVLGLNALGGLFGGLGGRGGAGGAAGRTGALAGIGPALLAAAGLRRGPRPDTGGRFATFDGFQPRPPTNLGTFDGFQPVVAPGRFNTGPLRQIIGTGRFKAGAVGIGAGLVGAGLAAFSGNNTVARVGGNIATGAALGFSVGGPWGAAAGAAAGLAFSFKGLINTTDKLAKKFRGVADRADQRVGEARRTIRDLRQGRPDAVLGVRQARLDVNAARRAAAEGRISHVDSATQAQLDQNLAQARRNLTVATKSLNDIDQQLENQTKRLNRETGTYWQQLQNVAGRAGRILPVMRGVGTALEDANKAAKADRVKKYVSELEKIEKSTDDKKLKEIARAAIALTKSLDRIPKKKEIQVFLRTFVTGPGVIPDSRGGAKGVGAIERGNERRAGKTIVNSLDDFIASVNKTVQSTLKKGRAARAKADAAADAAADARQRAAAKAAQQQAAAQRAAVVRAIARPVFAKGQLAKMTGEQLAAQATRLTAQIKELRQGGVTPAERINVARFSRALKIVNERLGKWIQARSSEIEKMGNQLQDRLAARRSRLERTGPLGAGAEAALAQLDAADTTDTLAAQRQKAERQLRIARRTHNQPLIAQANTTLRNLRNQSNQAEGAAVQARRGAAIAAEESGLRMIEIRQELANRADTPAAGAERAAFIRKTVIPRLGGELKDLEKQRKEVLRDAAHARTSEQRDNLRDLARVLKAEIGDKQLEIAEAQLTAQQQIQKNTAVMSNAQQLSFEFGGQRTTDLLTQGTGT
jgi:hypothetical protein